MGSAMKLAADEDTGSDAGAEGYEDKVFDAARGSAPVLANGCEVGVVFDEAGDASFALEHGAEWNVVPVVEIGCGEDDAGVAVGDAGCAGSEVEDLAEGCSAQSAHGLEAFDDELADAFGGFLFGTEERGPLGDDVAAEVGEHHADAGSADVGGGDVAVTGVEAE